MQMCYNKGCGNKFDPKDNKNDSCDFHPGAPNFHDAYKFWSCCNKKTTDFTTFLNTKGCTKGQHNPEKPPEAPKYVPDPSTKEEVIIVKAHMPSELPRPDIGEDMEYLKITVSNSLKLALEKEEEKKEGMKQIKNAALKGLDIESELANQSVGDIMQGIRIGESCKNNACKKTYEGLGTNLELCKHHPGLPIFHEGMKYWTCCQRKTSDFDQFLEQEGCQTTQHLWIKKDPGSGGMARRVNCKFDWHQTGTHVIVSIYAKLTRPEGTTVQVNPIRLNAHVVYAEGYFDLDLELKGVITVKESSVTLMGTKVEIKMRKAEALSWDKLAVPQVKAAPTTKNKKDDDLLCRIDAVDLSGL